MVRIPLVLLRLPAAGRLREQLPEGAGAREMVDLRMAGAEWPEGAIDE